jgi:hypothetical protein
MKQTVNEKVFSIPLRTGGLYAVPGVRIELSHI